jgi:hypothetical protein
MTCYEMVLTTKEADACRGICCPTALTMTRMLDLTRDLHFFFCSWVPQRPGHFNSSMRTPFPTFLRSLGVGL